MLYPNFKDLLLFEKSAKLVNANLNGRSISKLSGNYLSHFKGHGMEFSEVRSYNYGDEVRNIDWRVSARTDDTHVKIFQEEKQRNVLLIIDNNDYMNFGTRGTFKNVQAARIASTLGFATNKNSDRLGLYIFGNAKNRYEYYKPKTSKTSLLQGLKFLCEEKKYQNNYSLEGALFNLKRLNNNIHIMFVISSFKEISEDLEKQLFPMKDRCEIVLINVADDSDFKIPDVGKIVLKAHKEKFVLNTSNKKGVKKYISQYEKSQEKLKKLAVKICGRLINIRTTDDVAKVLALALRK